MPPAAREAISRHFLPPRLGPREDIADAVVFLASERDGFINGITIPIDGGFSIHTPSYLNEMATVKP